jgi:hypothetical protein
MLYIIGGAARAGKTKIARRMLDEHNIPLFCIDYLVSGLDQGAPSLGIVGESPTRPKAEKLWPILKGMLRNIVEEEPHYLVEGDSIWPQGVAKLRDTYHPQIRAVFIGYANSNPQQKLIEIHEFGGGVNDWIQDYSDQYILDLCVEMIEWSQFLQVKCKKYDLPYFDVSENFSQTLDQAYNWLCKPSKKTRRNNGWKKDLEADL